MNKAIESRVDRFLGLSGRIVFYGGLMACLVWRIYVGESL